VTAVRFPLDTGTDLVLLRGRMGVPMSAIIMTASPFEKGVWGATICMPSTGEEQDI
jgi:hypothetical protein